MATYTELFDLFSDNPLLNKIAVAVAVKADDIANDGAATAPQKQWAARVAGRPRDEAENLIALVLAENKTASVAAIQSAGDAAIQTNVDAVVDVLIDGAV